MKFLPTMANRVKGPMGRRPRSSDAGAHVHVPPRRAGAAGLGDGFGRNDPRGRGERERRKIGGSDHEAGCNDESRNDVEHGRYPRFRSLTIVVWGSV